MLEIAVNQEKEWLSSYRVNNDCWLSFHASKQRRKVKMNDITLVTETDPLHEQSYNKF